MVKRIFSFMLCSLFLTFSLALPQASSIQAEPAFEASQIPCDPETEGCTFLPLMLVPLTPPEAFAKVNPADGGSDQPVSLTLDWEDSPGASTYAYCLVVSGEPCGEEDWISTGAGTQAEVGELPRSTAYTWQVRAMNSYYTTEADAGAWWTFTTTSTAPPAAFGKVSPIDSPTHQPVALTLDWGDAAARPSISTASTRSTIMPAIPPGSAPHPPARYRSAGWHSTRLTAGRSKRSMPEVPFMLMAVCGGPSPPSSPLRLPLVNNTPSTIQLTSRSPLTWNGRTRNMQQVMSTASIPSSNSTCDGNNWISNALNTIAPISGLQYATTYYWQVRARNADSDTYANNGTWWSFRTATNSWTTVTSVNFETSSLPSGWTAYDQGTYTGVYYPARRTCRPFTGGSYSGWMVGGGTNGSALACGANYPAGSEALLMYPFSLNGASDCLLTFQLWLNSTTESGYFFMTVYNSDHSLTLNWNLDGSTGGWQPITHDLSAFRYQSGLTLALGFFSDGGTTLPEGAYVDDIILKKCTYEYCSSGAPPYEEDAPAPSGFTLPSLHAIPGGIHRLLVLEMAAISLRSKKDQAPERAPGFLYMVCLVFPGEIAYNQSIVLPSPG